MLEDEGFAVVVCLTPLAAMSLLDVLSFDLVIIDGLSREPGAVLVNLADLIRSAVVTPVSLFSPHRLDRDLAKAAGFSDVIANPFDLETLVRQVKVLLASLPGNGTSHPPQGDVTWPLAAERADSAPLWVSRERSVQAVSG